MQIWYVCVRRLQLLQLEKQGLEIRSAWLQVSTSVVVCAGVRHVVYLPELQQCVVQSSLMPIRRPMQYSPEQGSFQDLAEDQTSALLESWGFARTAAAASKSAVLQDLSVSRVTCVLLLVKQATGMKQSFCILLVDMLACPYRQEWLVDPSRQCLLVCFAQPEHLYICSALLQAIAVSFLP